MTQKEQGIPVEAGRELDCEVSRKVFGKESMRVRYLSGYTRPPEGNPAPASISSDMGAEGNLLDETNDFPWNHPVYEEAWVLLSSGETLFSHFGCDGHQLRAKTVPPYSFEMRDAWRVVQEMIAAGWWPTFTYRTTAGEPPLPEAGWDVELRCVADLRRRECLARAETLPHAICLAALKAAESLSGNPVVGEPVR